MGAYFQTIGSTARRAILVIEAAEPATEMQAAMAAQHSSLYLPRSSCYNLAISPDDDEHGKAFSDAADRFLYRRVVCRCAPFLVVAFIFYDISQICLAFFFLLLQQFLQLLVICQLLSPVPWAAIKLRFCGRRLKKTEMNESQQLLHSPSSFHIFSLLFK